MEELGRSNVGRHLIPLEASVAWPIPYQANERAYLILPIYSRRPVQDGRFAIFPWSAALTLEWTTERLVEYIDFQFKSPWSKLDFGQPIGIAEPFTDVIVEQVNTLLKLYDELFDAVTLGQTPPPFWIDLFRRALSDLIEPSHQEFYKQLAPKFYEGFIK